VLAAHDLPVERVPRSSHVTGREDPRNRCLERGADLDPAADRDPGRRRQLGPWFGADADDHEVRDDVLPRCGLDPFDPISPDDPTNVGPETQLDAVGQVQVPVHGRDLGAEHLPKRERISPDEDDAPAEHAQ
jgi:hypothetical protein